VRQLFPPMVDPYAFGWSPFGGGFVQTYSLTHGRGYFLKFPAAYTQTITGYGHSPDTVSVNAGWNFIGGPYFPIPVDSILTVPPGIIQWNRCFGFARGYGIVDTVYPGRGYIVRIIGAGIIIFRRPN